MVSVEITAIFAALLAILQVAFTFRVIDFRRTERISLGDGGNNEMQKRIRAHGNFIETVPMAVILLLLNELSGAGSAWLYGLGAVLVAGRICHYIGVAFNAPMILRVVGMASTLLVILMLAIMLVV